MKLANKKVEIFTIIIIIGLVIAINFITQIELQIAAGATGFIALILLIVQTVTRQRYDVPQKNYNIKIANDITVENIRDTKANRVSIVSSAENETFDDSTFVVVNLAEVDLKQKKSKPEIQNIHTYLGDFEPNNPIEEPQNIEDQLTNNINNSNEQMEELNKPIDENQEYEADGNIFSKTTQQDINITNNIKMDVSNDTAQKDIPLQTISATNIKDDSEIQKHIKKEFEYETSVPFQKLDTTLPVHHIIDLDVNLETKRDEFFYFIRQFFIIIRSVLDANTLAFVWVNHISKTLDFRLLLSETDTKHALITKQQMPFGNDIISQIVNEKQPQIISKLNTPNVELDYFSYYTKPVGTNSFIGIPVFFDNNVIAVLCADSKKINAFSQEDYSFLGCFTKAISRLVNIFDTTSREENAEQILELISGFNKLVSEKGSNFNEICNSITEYILALYTCTSIGVVSYNDTIRNWAVLSYRTIEDVDEAFMNENIDLHNSIIGECIVRNQTIPVANIPSEFTRINKYEPSINNGSFVSIPIRSTTDVYGALFIEYKDNPNFATTVDLSILQTICEQAGEMLEKIRLMQLYNKYVATEIKTGILTETTFKTRILEEFNKAADINSKLTFALVSLDKYTTLEDAKKKTIIFNKIIEVIRANIKSYEIIGRVNSDVIGVILFNRNTNQSKPIFEKIRQQLATRYFEIDNEKIAFTISVGLAHTNPKNSFDDFIANVTAALRKAEEHTNYVQIFE